MHGSPKKCYPPKTSGIYKIVCAPTGKMYVGSAACMHTRWHVHKHQLRKGEHHNRYLQRAWNKYGAAAFAIAILEEVPPEKLLEREAYWMRHTGCTIPAFGYNLAPTPGSSRGVKRSRKYLKAMAERKAKTWIVTNPEGDEFEVKNLSEFCRKNRLSMTMLYRVAYGTARHYRGWLCRPADTPKEWWEATRKQPAATDGRFRPRS